MWWEPVVKTRNRIRGERKVWERPRTVQDLHHGIKREAQRIFCRHGRDPLRHPSRLLSNGPTLRLPRRPRADPSPDRLRCGGSGRQRAWGRKTRGLRRRHDPSLYRGVPLMTAGSGYLVSRKWRRRVLHREAGQGGVTLFAGIRNCLGGSHYLTVVTLLPTHYLGSPPDPNPSDTRRPEPPPLRTRDRVRTGQGQDPGGRDQTETRKWRYKGPTKRRTAPRRRDATQKHTSTHAAADTHPHPGPRTRDPWRRLGRTE